MGLLLFHAGSETRLRAVEIVNAVSLEFVNKLEIMKSPRVINFLKAITIVKTIKILNTAADAVREARMPKEQLPSSQKHIRLAERLRGTKLECKRRGEPPEKQGDATE